MTAALDQIARDLDAVRALAAEDLGSLAPGALVELQSAAGRLKRGTDAFVAEVAGQVAARSTPEDGAGGMARRHGFSSPGRMVAKELGVSLAEAGRMMDVGAAIASPTPQAPPKYPHVARTVGARDLGTESASLITRGLDTLRERVSDERLEKIETRLVGKAVSLSVHDVRKLVQRTVAMADPATFAEREERAYGERSVTWRDDAGLVVINTRLDPASAAPLITALDAMVGDAFRRRRDDDPMEQDTRSVPQIRADALVTMARHVLGCKSTEQPWEKTTVVMRMSLQDVQRGEGVGEIDGVGEPVSVTRLRQMAADAEVIPAVLGGDGEILDFGRSRRFFSRAQRLALEERDGGCAWCHAPPSYCEAHHIRWWERDEGPTDLANGVMMCVSCHHRVHRDGWEIEVDGPQVWFRPPQAIDPARRRRLGGRAAVELSEQELAA